MSVRSEEWPLFVEIWLNICYFCLHLVCNIFCTETSVSVTSNSWKLSCNFKRGVVVFLLFSSYFLLLHLLFCLHRFAVVVHHHHHHHHQVLQHHNLFSFPSVSFLFLVFIILLFFVFIVFLVSSLKAGVQKLDEETQSQMKDTENHYVIQ